MFNLLYIIGLIGILLSPIGTGMQTNLHLENSSQINLSKPISLVIPLAHPSFHLEKKTDLQANLGESSVNYLKKLKKLGINLHLGSNFSDVEGDGTQTKLKHCAELTYLTLEKLPQKISSKVKDLTLHFDNSARRGLGGGGTIILRCSNETDAELVGVLMHEIGHVTDSSYLTGNFWSGKSEFMDGQNPVYNDDPSLKFYRISFTNEKIIKSTASKEDFVSGYAMTDPFEDFAETFNFYVLHGREFRAMKVDNYALNQKYNFMKDKIFGGHEFGFDTINSSYNLASRAYDSTLIAFNLNNFIAF